MIVLSVDDLNRLAQDLRALNLTERADVDQPGPACASWWYTVIRHVNRNLYMECGTHGEYGPHYVEGAACGPQGKYDGSNVAGVLALAPALLAAVRDGSQVEAYEWAVRKDGVVFPRPDEASAMADHGVNGRAAIKRAIGKWVEVQQP